MSKKKRIEELEREVEYLTNQVSCWQELCELKEELLDSLEEDYDVLQEALEASLSVQGVPYATIFNRLKLKWSRGEDDE